MQKSSVHRLVPANLAKSLLLLGFGLVLLDQSLIAQAQITPNGAGTVVNTQGNQTNITGGTQAGANLFHSFGDFNLNSNQVANFLSNPQTQNILGRINGGNPSFINGLVQVTGGNSNLFLMNPAGIIFGQGASLNVPASFTATTANQIGLGNNQYFAATGNNNYAALTGSPDSFLFTSPQAGSIVNAGNLAVGSGQNISLIAGNTINTGRLSAPGGEIQVLAVPGTNRVRLSQPGQVLSLEIVLPDSNELKAVDLPTLLTGSDLPGIVVNPSGQVEVAGTSLPSQQGIAVASGRIDVSSSVGNGGTVQIMGDRVAALNSRINANGATGGGTVRLGGEYLGGRDTGIAPALRFNSQRTLVDRDSLIRANATVTGEGGRVIVWADQNTGYFGRITGRGATGRGGFVEVSGKENLAFDGRVELSGFNGLDGSLLLDPLNVVIGAAGTDDAQIADGIIGVGEAPGATWFISNGALAGIAAGTAIDIAASNNIDFQTNVTLIANGTAPITFTAPTITASTGAVILNSRGRNVILDASNNINASSLGIITTTAGANSGSIQATASGGDLTLGVLDTTANNANGGAITLNTPTGNITSGGIDSSVVGNGNGGVININAQGNIITSGDIDSLVNGTGNGGAIDITAQGNITSGIIDSSVVGNGNGGAININAQGDIISGAIGSGVDGTGNGGAININAQGNITTSGNIASIVVGNGNGGAININAQGDIISGDILSRVDGTGNGGVITLNAQENIISGNILSDVNGNGNGGAINFTAREGNITSGIIASPVTTGNGNGGAIDITAQENIISGAIYSSVEAGDGNGGTVTLGANQGIFVNGSIESIGGGVGRTGGTIDIDAGNLVRVGLNNLSCNTSSICSYGNFGAGNGAVTIRHGGSTTTPFIVGNSATNGTTGIIDAGVGNVINTTTIIPVPPSTYTQGIVRIITTAPVVTPTIAPEFFPLLRNPAPPETPAPVVVGSPPETTPIVEPSIPAPIVPPVVVVPPVVAPEIVPAPIILPVISTPTPSPVIPTPSSVVTPAPTASPNLPSELRTALADLDPEDTRLEPEPPSGTLAFITNPSNAEIAARLGALGTPQNDIPAIQANLNQTATNTGKNPAQIYVFFTPQNLGTRNEDTLEIILITGRGESRRVQLSGITRSQVLGVVDNLQSGNESVNLNGANQLYQWILAPLESELQQQGINNLIFVLDPELSSLPLESLYDGQRFIRDIYTISRP